MRAIPPKPGASRDCVRATSSRSDRSRSMPASRPAGPAFVSEQVHDRDARLPRWWRISGLLRPPLTRPAFVSARTCRAAACRGCVGPKGVVSRTARWWLLWGAEQKSADHSGALLRFVQRDSAEADGLRARNALQSSGGDSGSPVAASRLLRERPSRRECRDRRCVGMDWTCADRLPALRERARTRSWTFRLSLRLRQSLYPSSSLKRPGACLDGFSAAPPPRVALLPGCRIP